MRAQARSAEHAEQHPARVERFRALARNRCATDHAFSAGKRACEAGRAQSARKITQKNRAKRASGGGFGCFGGGFWRFLAQKCSCGRGPSEGEDPLCVARFGGFWGFLALKKHRGFLEILPQKIYVKTLETELKQRGFLGVFGTFWPKNFAKKLKIP